MIEVQEKTKKRLKKYSRDEVLKSALEYFEGDALAADVWINKYALKDSIGNLYEKSPIEMHQRIARELYRIESKYKNPAFTEEQAFELLDGFKYIIPQGSPMAGIGNSLQYLSLSNCFVIGTDGESDSYGSIMKIDQEQVQLMKRRGGVGHDLSKIRPNGSSVENSALTSTGVVPFMERYSNSTREVAQDGRRGALMLSLDIEHPDAESFIDAKIDGTKVTGANISVRLSDSFMKSLSSKNNKFVQQFPVGSENPMTKKEINSKELWNKIVHNAWKSAEPGILFWDTIIKESLPDRYSDLGYKTISTNPCLTGDTKVYVADGRGSVPIKTLAEEGRDVEVFCYDDKGKLAIRTMRNPRITGFSEKIYKLTLDDGSIIKATGNHKFRLKNGNYKTLNELKYGDSLDILVRYNATFEEIFKSSNSKSSEYTWVVSSKNRNKSEHRIIAKHFHGEVPKGHVVHHKDYNSLNNAPENLEIMSKEAHDHLHSKDMIGDKNPMRRAKTEWTREKWDSYRENMSNSTSGNKNGRYRDDITNEEYKKHALELTKTLGTRFSKGDWEKYSIENDLPKTISKFRKRELFGGIVGLAEWAALELKIIDESFIGVDSRMIRSYFSLVKQGYDVQIENRKILINKKCEVCDDEFIIDDYRNREISICKNSKCRSKHISNNNSKMWSSEVRNKIKASKKEFYKNKREATSLEQLRVFSEMKFRMKTDPMKKEWEAQCKKEGVSADLRPAASNNHGSWKNFKELAKDYNHKVVSIEFIGYENVYNGTVDDHHNFFVGGFENKTKSGRMKEFYLNNLQCGEIALCADDSCRLLALNLYSYVKNPFTKEAYFDFDLFKTHSKIATRMMDDIVDIECEMIDRIISKIDRDPESEETKRIERNLWIRIKKKCEEGRRTGMGITGEGDMLAALGLTYGTKKATKTAAEIHKQYMLNVYSESCNLAKERGSFKIWDPIREEGSPILERIKAEDPKLYSDLMKYGRRNIALMTIAPTGSVSILTKTTSGIECAFLISYKRRRKINPGDKGAKVSFVDSVGDSWEEYNVFHHHFKTWMKVNNIDESEVVNYSDAQLSKLIESSPYHQATSNDVDWLEKVRMQGAIQKWIDHSISVTVNLPKDTTEETVSNVYKEAWKSGCKGCTVYRDGSRSGVLVSKEEKKQEAIFQDTHAPKRGKSLECVVTQFNNNKERWIGFLGLVDGRPYEIFTGLLENFPVPSYVNSGHIVKEKNKKGKNVYHFVYTDKTGTEIKMPNLNYAFSEEFYDMAKTFSAILRHGMPLPYVIGLIEGLNLDGDLINTWKSGVKRMIKKFIKDGSQLDGKVCPNCGVEALEYREGCVTCRECGHGKC